MTPLSAYRPAPGARTTVGECDTCGRHDRLRILRGGQLARCRTCISRYGIRLTKRDLHGLAV